MQMSPLLTPLSLSLALLLASQRNEIKMSVCRSVGWYKGGCSFLIKSCLPVPPVPFCPTRLNLARDSLFNAWDRGPHLSSSYVFIMHNWIGPSGGDKGPTSSLPTVYSFFHKPHKICQKEENRARVGVEFE